MTPVADAKQAAYFKVLASLRWYGCVGGNNKKNNVDAAHAGRACS